ncbi:MAG TPA: hypothetical protein VGO57_09990 [Verrucomicrobiae bacterium]
MGRVATHYDCIAGTLWLAWLLDVSFSSPDAALGDDFGRSAAKATSWPMLLCFPQEVNQRPAVRVPKAQPDISQLRSGWSRVEDKIVLKGRRKCSGKLRGMFPKWLLLVVTLVFENSPAF